MATRASPELPCCSFCTALRARRGGGENEGGGDGGRGARLPETRHSARRTAQRLTAGARTWPQCVGLTCCPNVLAQVDFSDGSAAGAGHTE
eukprot:6271962-Alexandrium_andersonii.AAC.1